MPTYTYECKKCGHAFDLFHGMSATPKVKCEECGGACKRRIGIGSGIIFKGSGFYETDYKRQGAKSDSGEKSESSSEKSGSTSESKSDSSSKPDSASKSDSSAKSGSKSSGSSDSKSASKPETKSSDSKAKTA